MVPKLLPGVHVGDMHLHEAGAIGNLCQGVAQSNGGMRQPTWVNDDCTSGIGGLVDLLNELAFKIRLEKLDLCPVLLGTLGNQFFDIT